MPSEITRSVFRLSIRLSQERIIADVRIMKLPDIEAAELAILVSDEWQGHAIGSMLIDYCIEIAQEFDIKTFWMEILKMNNRMLHLAKDAGFRKVFSDEDMMKVVLALQRCCPCKTSNTHSLLSDEQSLLHGKYPHSKIVTRSAAAKETIALIVFAVYSDRCLCRRSRII